MESRVIVIGGGLAGAIAALAAAKDGQDVLLVDRGSICLGTNSGLSGGVFTAPTATYPVDKYIEDTIEIGRMINHREKVELIGSEASRAFGFLSSFGITLAEMKDSYQFRPYGLNSIPGAVLMRNLSKILQNVDRIKKMTGFYVTDIVKEGNTAIGIKGFDREGKETVFYAPSIILASGGAGAIYRINDNQRNTMGQGYYLAAKAGLSLWDMEFVQFYPLVITGSQLPMTLLFPPFDRHIRLIDSSKRDILEAYNIKDINEAILKKRDEFSTLLMLEMEKGPVFLDCSLVEPSKWGTFPLNLLRRIVPDAPSRYIPISPAAHFFMGGVKTDRRMETSIEGLFACGEVTFGLHGANRRGGNALTECIVGGMVAGESAARRASKRVLRSLSPSIKGISKIKGRKNRLGELKEIKSLIKTKAWDICGIIRDGKDMEEGKGEIDRIGESLTSIVPSTFFELALREDLLSGVVTLKAVLKASMGREESRGSFKRREFPREDNGKWLKNSCLIYNQEKGDFSLKYYDINL
ncbi:MAG: FAD-dependent oxidoreductase [Syntrophorhabdaceae bacterium]|nr:FAD-dependent oxidoreductase [Syntrophorhabdaceae bacterium]